MKNLMTAAEANKYIKEHQEMKSLSDETVEVINVLSEAISNIENEVVIHYSDIRYTDETISLLRKKWYSVDKQWDERYDWTLDHWIVITF